MSFLVVVLLGWGILGLSVSTVSPVAESGGLSAPLSDLELSCLDSDSGSTGVTSKLPPEVVIGSGSGLGSAPGVGLLGLETCETLLNPL